MAKTKENTCIFLMSKTETREPHFQWIKPLVLTNDYFVGLSTRSDINVKTLEDVKKYIALSVKEKIELEAMNLNFLDKGETLPIDK